MQQCEKRTVYGDAKWLRLIGKTLHCSENFNHHLYGNSVVCVIGAPILNSGFLASAVYYIMYIMQYSNQDELLVLLMDSVMSLDN